MPTRLVWVSSLCIPVARLELYLTELVISHFYCQAPTTASNAIDISQVKKIEKPIKLANYTNVKRRKLEKKNPIVKLKLIEELGLGSITDRESRRKLWKERRRERRRLESMESRGIGLLIRSRELGLDSNNIVLLLLNVTIPQKERIHLVISVGVKNGSRQDMVSSIFTN